MKRTDIFAAGAYALRSWLAFVGSKDPLEQATTPNPVPRTVTLALGKIESLPPDTDVVATIEKETIRATFTERHYSCIEYVIAGLTTLAFGDGYRVTLRAGDAMWIPPLTSHSHGTSGDGSAETLRFAMRPVGERSNTPPYFRGPVVAKPPVQRYYESLVAIELPTDFATAPVAVDGMLTFAVVAGRASIRLDEKAVRVLETGDAIYVPALHRYELTTAGSSATLLLYSVFGESRTVGSG